MAYASEDELSALIETIEGRMKGRRKHDKFGAECAYCGALVRADSREMDHMPIPHRHGGQDVVPCCLSCHDMKDRFILRDWPVAWKAIVEKEFPKLSRETKIWLVKVLAHGADVIEGAPKW